MIHVNIIENPRPSLAAMSASLEQRTKRASSAEMAYFRRRAAQEAEAARTASCIQARRAHEEMAEAYRLRCRLYEQHSDQCQTDRLTASGEHIQTIA